jgi:very-short-patch-repair endonuclease
MLATPSPPLCGGEGKGEGALHPALPSHANSRYPSFMPTNRTISTARRLRQDATRAERRIWSFLRQRPAGLKFRRQHPIGPYIADFACPAARLVVELDGASHLELGAVERDAKRTAFLEAEGWRVVRFWNPQSFEEVEGIVGAVIEAAERE